jgi:hypothetical protein
MDLVTEGYQQWGDRWALRKLAAAISTNQAEADLPAGMGLLDQTADLMTRALAAHARRDDKKWWSTQFNEAAGSFADASWVLLLWMIHGSPELLSSLVPAAEHALAHLDEDAFSKLVSAVEEVAGPYRTVPPDWSGSLTKSTSPQLTTLLATILPAEQRIDFVVARLREFADSSEPIAYLRAQTEFALASRTAGYWPVAASRLRQAFDHTDGLVGTIGQISRLLTRKGRYKLPRAVAIQVMAEPAAYPRELVELSERHFQVRANRSLAPIEAVAAKQDWEGAAQ